MRMDLLVNILFALPVYQSVILSIILITSRKFSYSKLLMALFQLLMAFYFTFNLLYRIQAFEVITAVYFLMLPLILMFIPTFYLYILSVTTKGFRFEKKYSIHFIPAIIIACLNIPYLFASHAEKLDFISHGYSTLNGSTLFSYLLVIYMSGILGIFTLQLIYYSIQAFRLYRKHKVHIENTYSYTENINLDWLLALIICFVIFFVFNDILYLVGFRQQVLTQFFYNIAMLATTLYIGYRGLLQVDLRETENFETRKTDYHLSKTVVNALYSQSVSAVRNMDENSNKVSLLEFEKQDSTKKYSGSALTEAQKKVFVGKLQNLIQDEKIFINDKLSIEDVAVRLNTNTKYISQLINETYNKNFYNFINSYRIDEAKRMLIAEENEKYSILGIAQSVGFVSKSAFNVAFRRFTGLTPTEFKQNKSN